jgi:hypothetical protein
MNNSRNHPSQSAVIASLPRRAPAEITASDVGRESDFNLPHPKNASDSIVSSSEGESKKIEDSAEQP